jgi:hypothetical protein
MKKQTAERIAWLGWGGLLLVGAITGDVPLWVAVVAFGTFLVAWLVQRRRRRT